MSRILGLIRESIFAKFFGAGMAMDAFNVAFRIPNLLRDLFAEGAMSSAFVSRFSAVRNEHGEEEAFHLAREVITFLALLVGLIVTLAVIFSDEIVFLFAHALDAPTAAMASDMIQIMFPFLWLVSIASVFTGVLNTFRRFGLPALAPACFNLGTIFGGGACAYYFHHIGSHAIYGMALGTVIGGMIQWVLLLPQVKKVNFTFKPNFNFKSPQLKKVLTMMIPAVIGQSAFQVNLLITTNFASQLGEGSISWLSYAYRFMQLPIGVFSVAIAIVSLPRLSELVTEKKFDDFNSSLLKGLKLSLFLSVPSCVGLYLLSDSIISCIYGYGEFAASKQNILLTAGALQFYVLGLSAWSLVKIFAPAFYAVDKSWTPMWGSFIAIGVNGLLCYYFINNQIFENPLHNHYGLAIATTISATVNALFLYLSVQKYEWRIRLGQLWLFGGKLVLACGVMAALVYVFKSYVISEATAFGKLAEIAALGATISVSAILYFWMGQKLKLEEVSFISSKLFKKASS